MFPGMFGNRKKYTYPDGTVSFNRPGDGQVFTIWDASQNPASTWQWDGLKEQWFNISSGKPTPQNTRTFVVPNAIEYIDIKINIDDVAVAKCECGSDSVGSPRHSSWCKKHSAE